MKTQEKSKYKTISSEERAKIIQYFIEGGHISSQIAQLTGHNLSTIKAIYRIYKKEGRTFKKEKRDRTYNVIRNFVICIVDDKPKTIKVLAKQQAKEDLILRDNEKIESEVSDYFTQAIEETKQKVLNLLDDPNAQYNYLRELQILTTNGISENEFETINRECSSERGQELRNLLSFKKQTEEKIRPEGLEGKLLSLKTILETQLQLIYQ